MVAFIIIGSYAFIIEEALCGIVGLLSLERNFVMNCEIREINAFGGNSISKDGSCWSRFYRDERIKSPELAFQYCKEIAKEINEIVLRMVALDVLNENKNKFLTIKGSDWQHHNYAGGLIVHTCNVTLSAIRLAELYSDKVNMDLLVFCALMHDVGKLFDYENQEEFLNENDTSMNQALLGHGFEGANYISEKLKKGYSTEDIVVSVDYAKDVITQVSHCVGAHMDGFGACAKQQMFEVLILGCADKVDAYLEQTIVEDRGKSVVVGTGEIFYKSCVNPDNVFLSGDSPLRRCLH